MKFNIIHFNLNQIKSSKKINKLIQVIPHYKYDKKAKIII